MVKPAAFVAFGFALVKAIVRDMVAETANAARVDQSAGSCSDTISKGTIRLGRCGFRVKSLSDRFGVVFASLVFLDECPNELLGTHQLLSIGNDFTFASPDKRFSI